MGEGVRRTGEGHSYRTESKSVLVDQQLRPTRKLISESFNPRSSAFIYSLNSFLLKASTKEQRGAGRGFHCEPHLAVLAGETFHASGPP
jgi:hypothetical protein